MTETEKLADVVVAAVRAATAPLLARCAALEHQIGALEARAAVPGPPGPQGERGEAGPKGDDGVGVPGPSGRDGVDGKDAPTVDVDALALRASALIPTPKDGRDGVDGKDGLNGKDAPAVDLDDVVRRAAALVPAGKDGADGRDGQPGVPGAPGRDGATGERGEKGLDGKDGAVGRDGTLEGASLKQIDDRTWQIVRADGSALSGVFALPLVLDRGVYQPTKRYEKGDGVTFGGSFWIAQGDTSEKPGDGATAWRLAVKRGRDGAKGEPGERGGPGPKGEKGDPGRNFS
jgi:collagen type III alpha